MNYDRNYIRIRMGRAGHEESRGGVIVAWVYSHKIIICTFIVMEVVGSRCSGVEHSWMEACTVIVIAKQGAF